MADGPTFEDGDWDDIRAACPVLMGHLSPLQGVLPPSMAAVSAPLVIPDLATTTVPAITSIAPPVVFPAPATSAMAIDPPNLAAALAGPIAAPPLTQPAPDGPFSAPPSSMLSLDLQAWGLGGVDLPPADATLT